MSYSSIRDKLNTKERFLRILDDDEEGIIGKKKSTEGFDEWEESKVCKKPAR